MVHLILDFNQLEKDKGWQILPASEHTDDPTINESAHVERNKKMLDTFLALILKIPCYEIIVYGKDGRPHGEGRGRGFEKPYIELFLAEKTIKVRHLTYLPDRERKAIEDIAAQVINGPYEPLSMQPCNLCGKAPHTGTEGICLDCSDEHGLNLIEREDYAETIKKWRPYMNSHIISTMKVGSASYIVEDENSMSSEQERDKLHSQRQRDGQERHR